MSIQINRNFFLEVFHFNSFFIRAFGYEVYKEPGEKMVIDKLQPLLRTPQCQEERA